MAKDNDFRKKLQKERADLEKRLGKPNLRPPGKLKADFITPGMSPEQKKALKKAVSEMTGNGKKKKSR